MTYLEKLNAAVEQELLAKQQKQLEDAHKATVAWRNAMMPLEQRLKRVLDEMPESIKTNGLSLPALQQMLKGRWRGNAHPGELGDALRNLGYVRTRSWHGDEIGFTTLWKQL